jgi:type II secretory pathway pseudopilin PulG
MISKLDEKGFSLVELLLILILISIIGFTGYYVWNSKSKSDETLNKASAANSAQNTTSSKADWLTFSDKDSGNSSYAGAASGGDSVPISFKYPSDWKTAPVGTMIHKEGSAAESSYNILIPKGRSVNSSDMSFGTYALEKSQTAKEHFDEITTASPGQVGPNWESVSTFKTKNGYSGNIGRLAGGNVIGYEITVSNTKSIASFGYSSTDNKYVAVLKEIVDTVQFLN